jgi:uncharacterized repeat protein (TIGR01451 family)
MNKGFGKILGAAALIACGFASQAFAQEPGCIVLKSVAEIEQEVAAADGTKTKQRVPASKVIPGTEVLWTVTATNVCKQPSDKVTVNNAVPDHMTLVPNSAAGPGSDVTYSVDGKTFAAAGQLTVQDEGAIRAARADEYRHIRWEWKSSLQPGASANASFRAVLN